MDEQNTPKTYYLDPGKGTKTAECPHYSNYLDGRDIPSSFIIPPKGHVLVGFDFEPFGTGKYDGKIVARFEKIGFGERLRQNIWRYLASVAIIVLIGMILYTVFNRPDQELILAENENITIENNDFEEEVPVTSYPEVVVIPEDALETSADTIDALDAVAGESVIEKGIGEKAAEEIVQEGPSSQKPTEESVVEEKPAEKSITDTVPQLSDKELKALKAQFDKEFWDLIHQKDKRMTSYGKLFRKYNGQFKSKEFRYLTMTILRSASNFNTWSANLNRIPTDEIRNIRTIDDLKNKLEEYK